MNFGHYGTDQNITRVRRKNKTNPLFDVAEVLRLKKHKEELDKPMKTSRLDERLSITRVRK